MTNEERVGIFGEKLIKYVFEKDGNIVRLSKYKYNYEFDCWLNGIHTEIKTQPVYENFEHKIFNNPQNAFTINNDQKWKCETVDKLLFVEIPLYLNDYEFKFWEAPDIYNRKFYWGQRKNKNIIYGIKKKDCKLIKTYYNKEKMKYIRSISKSKYYKW